MPISWNIPLVVVSVLVAIVGSFTSLAHAQRMRVSNGQAAMWWMLVGAITLGATIWSMHFIGMLAMQLPIPLTYDPILTFLSVLPAIAAALLAFWVLRDASISNTRLLFSSLLMGAGISVMHYTGMAALKMSPPISYNPWIFMLSILIAIIASWGAMLMMYQGGRIELKPLPRSILGATVMGVAISGMHYTAMLGMQIEPGSMCLSGSSTISPHLLALPVELTALFWFGGGILATLFDQRLERQNAHALSLLTMAHKDLQLQARLQAEAMTQSLRDSQEELQQVLDSVAEGIYGVDMQGNCTFINAAGLSMLGYADATELIGQSMHVLIHHSRPDGSLYPENECRMYNSYRNNEKIRVNDEVFWRRDHTPFPVEYWSHPIVKDGVVRGAVATFFDISERKRNEQRIHKLAFYDALTNLPNRRLLMDRLQHALAVSERNLEQGAIIFLDLDHFKTLNDTQGHEAGDLLLVEVASRLSGCVRDGDTVSRLGGDEFVVVLESLGTDARESAAHAERIAEKIQSVLNQPHLIGDRTYYATPSIGIAMFQGHHHSMEDLLKHADIAMYQAKTAGRNAIRFYDPDTQSAIEARVAMENELRLALEKQQFQLHYQVQVDSAGAPLGAEILLRWAHPKRGLVSPAQFIPLAEETGLIVPIGFWVLQVACAQLRKWQFNELTCGLSLAVNVSAKQFRQPDFVAQVKQILHESGAKPSLLKLELTESMVLEDIEDTIAKMGDLKLLGVRFSMDDFGTGYSSLRYLKQLPLNQIKIDRSFVLDIATDPNDAAIVQTIIAMGAALGLEVIAEGVETEAQRDFLSRHGCHVFQGYLFSKPLPHDQFLESVLHELPRAL